MQAKRVVFPHRLLPALLVAPQLAVTAVFFLWPAAEALWQSTLREDAFGLKSTFVGLANFRDLFADPDYLVVIGTTLVFSFAVAGLSLALGLAAAALADRARKGALLYQTLFVWPYAVAPAVAGVIFLYLFEPSLGPLARAVGPAWNHKLIGWQALSMVVMAASWKQVAYDFLFFLAALQSIPRSLMEAAEIDAAGPFRRFFTVSLPLIAPTGFFLLVVNLIYAFFETFGVIHATTLGGPGLSTTTMVFRVFRDGFIDQRLGASAAESVVLLLVVAALTVVQFRFVERKVHY
ncbi:MAG: sn-glycerol-3-phosphate ABC transporter permease UgpA [Hyphomicrobiales bacterium]|nr:sn-glycerol-3-phosphate ABC transporter permease UgpA [Hyphomicrobiales bacterium]MDE2017833.1 sn-glycerol-3-phosphate ABC transporter permease UgpA [Hyphomicrobiales bacterium]